jgi:hypothetical protein
MKPSKCDACGKRMRPSHHELHLTDPRSGQVIGHYHARPDCQEAATRYFQAGVVLLVNIVHPHRCGNDFEACDAGLADMEALA